MIPILVHPCSKLLLLLGGGTLHVSARDAELHTDWKPCSAKNAVFAQCLQLCVDSRGTLMQLHSMQTEGHMTHINMVSEP